MPLPIRLSVIAPAYNESTGIRSMVAAWHRFLAASPDISLFEIIVCNDGSTDATGSILNELAASYSECFAIHLPHRQGAAVALSYAMRATQLDWIMTIDADNQFPIENITLLLAALKKTPTLLAITGIRGKHADCFYHRLGASFSNSVFNLIYRSRLKDSSSACKLIAGPLARSLQLEAKGLNYSVEITARLLESGIPIEEVAIVHQPRLVGKNKVAFLTASTHRCLFIFYLAIRQALCKAGILVRRYDDTAPY